jgi:hypothetical protein
MGIKLSEIFNEYRKTFDIGLPSEDRLKKVGRMFFYKYLKSLEGDTDNAIYIKKPSKISMIKIFKVNNRFRGIKIKEKGFFKFFKYYIVGE